MLNRLIEEIKTKYLYVVVLVIYIVIFLGVAICDFLPKNATETGIIINDTVIKLEYGMLDETHITLEDMISNFTNNVYYDKVARKLVITSFDNILKIKAGDEYSLLKENTVWYDIYAISEYFGCKSFKDTRSNSIYLYNENELLGVVLKNRTEVYAKTEQEIIGILDAKSSVNIILDDNIFLENVRFVTVKVTDENGHNYIGRIAKNKLAYEEVEVESTTDNHNKIIMTTVSKELNANTALNVVNTLAVEMLRINSEKSITYETYTLPSNVKQDVYAVLSNGYRQTNFDNSILSNIITSDTNKETISSQILEYINKNNLKGLVIDFKNFKTSDKKLIEQYIKELSAMLHKNEKTVMLKMNDISNYNIENINGFVDYIVVQAYGYRTLASKTSGSHSTVSYVTNMLEQFNAKVNADELILELAPYSILWTEKAGGVIDSEIYTMNTASEYIKINEIQTIFDTFSGQNMINYTKGSITYKMWLEDKTSITAKIKLANSIGTAGIAIYKSGYENKSIYSILDLEEE